MDTLLTPAEIAERWHVRRTRVYQLLRENALPSVYLGRSVRVPLRALEAFVAAGGWRGRPAEDGQAA
jgi:excisionase family DNA binding protein